MNFNQAVKNLNRSLSKKQPLTFNHYWVKNRVRKSYNYIVKHVKTELGETDWDKVVSRLDRGLQKKWMKDLRRRNNKISTYEDEVEVAKIIKKYQNKLYTFISQADAEDRLVCDWISIRLVRLAQKGNLAAKRKVILLVSHLVSQWVEDFKLPRWKGYDDLIYKNIESCIRRFRYAGSFLGYLYRTLEYSGRGLKPLEAFSLNGKITGGKANNAIYDIETGETKIFNRHCSQNYYK